MISFRNTINKGSEILKKNFIETANIDAELLLSFSIKQSREKILLNLEKKLDYHDVRKYFELIERRKKKEPISLIIGKKTFWKYDFYVNKDVLTPRKETEFLIEEILKLYKNYNKIRVLDIGTGSGCIIISLMKEKIRWSGIAVDISELAIKVAKYNAKIQQVENRIKFIKSDIDKFFSNKYDLIVSNPPYINHIGYNNLDLGVKDYEPKKALYGGIDGLRVIEKVIEKSSILLKNNGFLIMEIGLMQYNKTFKILRENGFYVKKVIKDYQRINRCIVSQKVK